MTVIICEIDDQEDVEYCPNCGNEKWWVDCHECCGNGYFDWDTLQFEDPLWYDFDDIEPCTTCDEHGGWLVCPSCHPETFNGR